MDEGGTTIPDGTHGIAVHGCDDLNKISREEQELFLRDTDSVYQTCETASVSSQTVLGVSSLSIASPASTGVEFFKRGVSSWIGNKSGKDMVFIRTKLCSTKFTQNGELTQFIGGSQTF